MGQTIAANITQTRIFLDLLIRNILVFFFLEENLEVFRKPIDNACSVANHARSKTSLLREPVQLIILTLGNSEFDSRL